jgi:hypothetical protein
VAAADLHPWGNGADAITMQTPTDPFGGCGDVGGITYRAKSGEDDDLIVFSENDANDWAVGIGGGGWRSFGNAGGYNGYDIAEFFFSDDPTVEEGDIVVSSTRGEHDVDRSGGPGVVIGVVSTTPAVYMVPGGTVTGNSVPLTKERIREDASHYMNLVEGYWNPEDAAKVRPFYERMARGEAVPVALAGRVPVKVSDESGPVRPGDRLALSARRPGYAKKATEADAVTIGVALTAEGGEAGAGKVFVFLGRQDNTGLVRQADLAAQEAQVARLSSQVAERDQRISALEAEVAALRALEKRVAALEGGKGR